MLQCEMPLNFEGKWRNEPNRMHNIFILCCLRTSERSHVGFGRDCPVRPPEAPAIACRRDVPAQPTGWRLKRKGLAVEQFCDSRRGRKAGGYLDPLHRMR